MTKKKRNKTKKISVNSSTPGNTSSIHFIIDSDYFFSSSPSLSSLQWPFIPSLLDFFFSIRIPIYRFDIEQLPKYGASING